MKKFYAPEISIEMYDVEDIITASGTAPTLVTADDTKKGAILNDGDTVGTMVGVEW